MRNAGLEEAQARIKIAGKNINNLSYADDITLMEESEEKPESLDESEKVRLMKEISPGISLEGMMLKLKLQYFGHLM